MTTAVVRLAEALAQPPGIGIAAGRIGAVRPASVGDLPTLAVSLELEENGGRASRLIREVAGVAETGATLHGRLALEVWAAGPAQAADATARIETRLAERGLLREHGYLRIAPARLQALEHVRRESAAGSPFGAWLQALEYRFAFEDAASEAEDAGAIGRIDVAVDEGLGESFVVP